MSKRRRPHPSCPDHRIEAAILMGGACVYGCPFCGHVETAAERAWARMGQKQVRDYLDRRYARMTKDRKARQGTIPLAVGKAA